MYAPVQRLRTAAQVNPQIPMGFRTDLLPQWIPSRMPKFQQCFQILRAEWYSRQSSQNSLIDEVYQTFESISYVFDFMVENPGKDMIAAIQILPGTESEQTLAIRPLAASINGSSQCMSQNIPVPIIAVEWHLSRKVDNCNSKLREAMAGFREDTLFQPIDPKDLAEFEHIVAILRENYKALDVQNEIGLLEKHCTDKRWKLSVICPANPLKKGDLLKCCQVCQKPGGETCCRCGGVNYCSRECQKSHWNSHKKSCEPKK